MGQLTRKKAKRQDDEVTRLEKEIRELKSINRSLMKQLKKLSKGIHKGEYEEALEEVHTRGKKKQKEEPDCEECGRSGGISEFEIAGRRFRRCSICGWKSGKLK